MQINLIECNLNSPEQNYTVAVHDDDDAQVAMLTVSFVKESAVAVTLTRSASGALCPDELLIAAVLSAIMRAYTADHELPTDVFIDEEGYRKALQFSL